jgi:uncharacterized LabA/DUF88 family protein
MEDTIIFIDSGFLSKLSKHFGKGAYLIYDIGDFSISIAKKENLNCEHIFYYTAPPFQSKNPIKEERERKERYDKFIKQLCKNEKITVREGRCQSFKDKEGKFIFKQKAVDSLAIIDLMSLPIEYPKIRKIILIACDSDFVPVIKKLGKSNIKTILYTYYERKRESIFATSNELIKSVNKYVILKKQDFDNAPLNKLLRRDK